MKTLLTILFLLIPLLSHQDGHRQVPRKVYAEWEGETIKAYDPIMGLNRKERDLIINEIYEENR